MSLFSKIYNTFNFKFLNYNSLFIIKFMLNKEKTIHLIKFSLTKLKSFVFVGFFELFFIVWVILLFPGPTSYGHDSLFYFAQLISLFEDGDLDLVNNLASFPVENVLIYHTNFYSIGPALFWAPFYLIGNFFFSILIFFFPFINNMLARTYGSNAVSYGLNIALCNLGTLFYTYLGLKLLGDALRKYFNEKINPTIIQFSVFFCTPLIFYVFSRPLFAHAISFFIISLLIYLWVKWHNYWNLNQLILTFLLIGIASCVRWQNILFTVIFFPQMVKTILELKKSENLANFFKNLLLYLSTGILSFIIGFSPQLIAWLVQFGVPTPPQARGDKFDFFNPNFLKVWFGWSGFFTWHPFALVYIIGLFILIIIGLFLFYLKRELYLFDGLVLLLAFLIQSYLWAIWTSPTAGCSFGHRGLIGTLPMLSFGLATILIGFNKTEKFKYILETISWIIVVFLAIINLYYFALLGHFYGNPFYTCIYKLSWESYFNIDWKLIIMNFIPVYLIEKIIIITCLVIIIICTSSFYNYIDKHGFKFFFMRLQIHLSHALKAL